MDLKSSKGEYVFDDKFNPPKNNKRNWEKNNATRGWKTKKNHIGIFREYE